MSPVDDDRGWRWFLRIPHGWISWTALAGVCLAGQFFSARRGHYDWIEDAAAAAVIAAGLVTAVWVPRELRLAALLLSKGVVVGLLFDASVRATGPTHDETGAGWLLGAVLGAGLVVFAGSVLEQRDVLRRESNASPVGSVAAPPVASEVGPSMARPAWALLAGAAFAGALLGAVARQRGGGGRP